MELANLVKKYVLFVAQKQGVFTPSESNRLSNLLMARNGYVWNEYVVMNVPEYGLMCFPVTLLPGCGGV